jgi:hypothetical protein
MTKGSLVSDLRLFFNQLSTFFGLPLDDSFCPLYVSIHASSKREAAFASNKPLIFAVVIITDCVFLVTVLVFLFYNYVVGT